jgi:DNA (cytosine-5)-methyltransferase 1
MKAIGIHIYAGGFTLGVVKHFEVLAHLENSKFGQATVKHNFPNIRVYDNPETWPVEEFKEVDFIFGNPPCKFFSSIGAMAGKKLSDKYTEQSPVDHTQFQAVCMTIKPKIFVFESVLGILTSGSQMIHAFTTMCNENGYSVTLLKHNLNYLGIPQNRKRVFIIAHNVDLVINYVPTLPAKSVGEILRDIHDEEVVNLHPNQAKLMHLLKPGQRMHELFFKHFDNMAEGKPSVMKKRLDPDKPCPVIATHADYYHPFEDKLLTPKEAAALCGYPDDYKFIGPQSDRFGQIGAAVLPPAGEFIARIAKESLIENKQADKICNKTVDLQESKITSLF